MVIVIIAALAGLSAPMILRQRKAADRTQATSNAKQLSLALIEFDQEFGSFPDNDTAELVSDATGTDLTLSGDSSNDYLRQLVAYGIQSEDIFYAKTTYTREPDNVISTGKALDAGEVGFGYVMLTGNVAQNTAGNPGRPVLVAPLLDASTNWEFDPDPYGGKAVILKLDTSVDQPLIRDKDKYVTVGGGRTLQQTGDDTVWGTASTPMLAAPRKRGS
ncbi:hypothetical protein HAHE_11200 [Haloferula helveola]|uniref:Uncharacterized protein n=1 Tax=Haloferula helveola TaxID=490095 RepID=A0ABM7R897_9BACT|nr:hypothetical protein HAHE_11200 [Haloferula helveola]